MKKPSYYRLHIRNLLGWLGLWLVLLFSPSLTLAASCGATWTATILAPGQEFYGVAWSGSQFVAVGRDANVNSGLILTSPDGTNWTVRNNHPLVDGAFRGIAWSGSQFVVVSGSGTIQTSGLSC